MWNIDKIGSIVERYWQSKVEVMRLQWSPYQENTELTHKIQELHALVCASCYAQYELLVLQNQFGPDSPPINHQQLKLPLQSWSEEELINGDQETFSFFSELYDNLLECQLLGVLHHMGMDRWVPIYPFYPHDIQTWFVNVS